MVDPRIEFVRLTQVPVAAVIELLNEPRNSRHMPLAASFTEESAAEWIAAKDAQWASNGYGPWAVLLNGEFAGWCGFQREEDGADFALVLSPARWGHGRDVAREALRRGFEELALDEVTIALPYSRSPERIVPRLGFRPDGEVAHGGTRFRRYRLTRQAWAAVERADVGPFS